MQRETVKLAHAVEVDPDSLGRGGAASVYILNRQPADRDSAAHEPHCPVPRARLRGEGAACLCAGSGAVLRFQTEPGGPGVTNEALLTVLKDRLTSFQSGEFPCPENAEALEHIQKARAALERRTAGRQARGVEGSYQS
jgi:hypothetical protein